MTEEYDFYFNGICIEPEELAMFLVRQGYNVWVEWQGGDEYIIGGSLRGEQKLSNTRDDSFKQKVAAIYTETSLDEVDRDNAVKELLWEYST